MTRRAPHPVPLPGYAEPTAAMRPDGSGSAPGRAVGTSPAGHRRGHGQRRQARDSRRPAANGGDGGSDEGPGTTGGDVAVHYFLATSRRVWLAYIFCSLINVCQAAFGPLSVYEGLPIACSGKL